MRLLWLTVAASVSLTGCDKQNSNVQIVGAFPLIQDVIARQVPVFNGKWHANIMNQVCRLASGELNREGFNNWFVQHHVDVAEQAKQDSGFRFVAQLNASSAKKSCAAWIVSSVLSPVQAWGTAMENDALYQEKMASMTPLTKEVIELLAASAAQTSGTVYHSEGSYQQAVEDDFARRADDFLSKTLNAHFVMADYHQPGSDEMLYRYQLDHKQSKVLFNGETWLGNGKIKGWHYTVKITENSTY